MRLRPNLDQYFLTIAYTVATRSTCLHKQVGCVLVDQDNRIISTGYNGAPKGYQHCEVCLVEQHGDKGLCPAAHAEQNALLGALANQVHKCYTTLEPCVHCARMLLNTSCVKVVYLNDTSPTNSGFYLWSKVHDPTTWQHQFGAGTNNR